ncbi:MAG: hypothetical protein J1E00_09300, partial [Oscillospiraceae bacterium]|nr:hypothetical protein [Oscillospiraceae bacterium]
MKKTLAIALVLVMVVSCLSVLFVSADEAEAKPFWVVAYDDGSLEGAGVIFSDTDGAGKWWTHVAFAPIEGAANAYEIVAISDGISEGYGGKGENLDVPAGGFVYAVNVGNNYKSDLGDPNGTDYINANCNAMIADVQTWKVGDQFVFSGVDFDNFTAVPTTTPEKNWYDADYVCTATYSVYDPNAQTTPDEPKEPEVVEEVITVDGDLTDT